MSATTKQNLPMEGFGDRARARAKDLGLSDAEVARRAAVESPRYGKYIRDEREPDFQTLLRICAVLNLTPNDLLQGAGPRQITSNRDRLIARITSSCASLADQDLKLVDAMLEGAVRSKRT